MQFKWKGILQSGENVNGIIESDSLVLAKVALRKKGIITRSLIKKRTYAFNNSASPIKQIEITYFTRQLATLFKAGIPLMRSLDILEHGTKNQQMKTLVQTIKCDLESGLMFTQALQKHPLLFNPLFCSMINIGEQSGSLDVILEKLATHKEKIVAIKKKINKALAYPIAVVLIAIVVTSCLLLFVIPEFESLFASFGAELPCFTRYVIRLSAFFNDWWLTLLSIFILIIYSVIYSHQHFTQFSKMAHQIALKLPFIGEIVLKTTIARITRTLSITFAAGLPLMDSLASVADVAGNQPFMQALYNVKDEISNGQSLHQAIRNTQLFPCLVVQLIAIGEESGTLEKMLEKIACIYEEQVDGAVDTLNSLLEPAIMTILGLLVGGLVIAMYLPIIKLGSVV